MAGELELYGPPAATFEDRWLVELWSTDEAQRAWLLLGQTAEDRAALREWLEPAPTAEVSEPTRNERPLEDTWVRPANVVSLAEYRARRASEAA